MAQAEAVSKLADTRRVRFTFRRDPSSRSRRRIGGVRSHRAALHARHRLHGGCSDDAQAESLVLAARSMGYVVEAALEQSAAGRLATVRLRRANEPIVDLLFASCGIEEEIATAATSLLVLEKLVPVATVGHLIAMKLLSRDPKKRPRDEDDLIELARVADDDEWNRAVKAVALIEARGFARKRDLRAALADLRALDLTDETSG